MEGERGWQKIMNASFINSILILEEVKFLNQVNGNKYIPIRLY